MRECYGAEDRRRGQHAFPCIRLFRRLHCAASCLWLLPGRRRLLNTQEILAGLARNPNAGGTLFLSLGCEVNAPSVFGPVLGDVDPDAVKILIMQEVGDEIEEGLRRCEEIYEYVSAFRRTSVLFSKLVAGVNCGGSDGLSGITANPLVGEVSSMIIRRGGGVIMTGPRDVRGGTIFDEPRPG